MGNQGQSLTVEEERQMDLISNVIIDIILSNKRCDDEPEKNVNGWFIPIQLIKV